MLISILHPGHHSIPTPALRAGYGHSKMQQRAQGVTGGDRTEIDIEADGSEPMPLTTPAPKEKAERPDPGLQRTRE